MQVLMDGLVCQDVRVLLVLQAGQEYQDPLDILELKDSLVQGDILGALESRYILSFNTFM